MPISKINLDGSVDVYNSKTGQVQNGVRPEALGAISPRLVAEYQSKRGEFESQQQARSIAESGIPIDKIQSDPTLRGIQAEQVKSGTYKPSSESKDLSESERKFALGLTAAKKALNSLEAGTVKTGPVTTTVQKIGEFFGKTGPGTDFRSQLALAQTAIKSGFLGAAQSTGELKGIADAIGNPYIQEDVLKQKLSQLVSIVESQISPTAVEAANKAAGVTSKKKEEITNKTINSPQTGVNLRDIALKAADIAPTAGGIVGSFAGSTLGVPGALVGTVAGTSGGMVIKQKVRDFLGAQDKTPMQQLDELKNDVTKNVALEALGLGAGKFILEPLAKVGGYALKVAGKTVDNIPTQSFRFAPSDITKFAHKHAEELGDFLVKRGFLGEDALDIAASHAQKFQESFDALALNKNIQIPISKVGQRFADEISELAGKGSRIVPSVAKNVAQSVLKEWDNIVEQSQRMGKEFVTPEELTLFRRTVDDLIPDSQWIDPSIKNVNIRVRRIMNDVVSDAVEGRLIGEGGKGTMKDLGKELSKVYDFLEFAEKRSGKGKGSLVANLTRILTSTAGAGLGFSAGGPMGAIAGGGAGLAAETALRDPNVLKGILSAANVARKAGKALSPAMEAALRAAGPAIGATGQLFSTQ